jgi:hypothetical protein
LTRSGALVGLGLLALAAAAGTRVLADREPQPVDLARLKQEQAALARRLEAAVAADPTATRALGAGADVAIAVRSEFLAELAAEVAHQYLDEVQLDLSSLQADAGGDLHAKGWLGEIRLGHWQVAVTIEKLRGRLEAGHPQLGFRQGRIDVSVPVRVRPSSGTMLLAFSWDTKGVANLVCDDFEARLALDGRVLPQQHVLSGELRLAQGEDAAVPVFERRKVPIRLDLSPESWGSVEGALRSQDSLGRCGILLKPEKVVAELRRLADAGIAVSLPSALFRPVSLPASVAREVRLGSRTLELSVRSEGLQVSRELVWSTGSVTAVARD